MDEPMFGESIADGTGVMIFSCITGLEKMKTARGKNVASWTIEDSSNRIPGILFPNSFEIVERRSHHSTNLMESERDEKSNSPGEDSKSSVAVKRDARVVGGERRIMSSPGFRRLLSAAFKELSSCEHYWQLRSTMPAYHCPYSCMFYALLLPRS